MTCPNCGAQVEQDAHICNRCGHDFWPKSSPVTKFAKAALILAALFGIGSIGACFFSGDSLGPMPNQLFVGGILGLFMLGCLILFAVLSVLKRKP